VKRFTRDGSTVIDAEVQVQMRRKAITIRDVAKLAGVGISTVSYVLNGNDQHVSPATREQILAAARELNYRPNAIARSMVKQTTSTIGLIITELQNQLFVPIVEGVEEVLRGDGYHILLASAADVDSEISAIETLKARQVDGIIFMSLSMRYPTDHLMRLRDEGMPFVVINRDLDEPEINLIQFDDRKAAGDATHVLNTLGHRRIGTIYGPKDGGPAVRRRSAVERYEGWRDVMLGYGRAMLPKWRIGGDYTYDGGYEAAKLFASRYEKTEPLERPTAIFVASDMMAVGVLKGLHDSGLIVPDDLTVITIGDPPFAAYTIPALTTYSMPIEEAGRVAARILMDCLHASTPLAAQHIVLKFTLQIRESVGGPKGGVR